MATYGVVASKPFWFPPVWALHFTYLASSFLMGLSACLVWAEGGFYKKPAALSLYLAQLGLSLIWDPIVFSHGCYLGVGLVWLCACLCLEPLLGALASLKR